MEDNRNNLDERLDSDSGESREESLRALLQLAGPVEQIPSDIRQRVYARARAELPKPAKMSVSWRWAVPLAMAASVLTAVLMSDTDVAVPERPLGTVLLAKGDGLVPGDEIRAGDVLDTAQGEGLSVALSGGVSLRIDENTVLEVESAKSFHLMAGRVYIDTGDGVYPRRKVAIRTATGTATDVGTQFSVRYERANMTVAVREGRVDLAGGGDVYSADRGEQITLRPGTSALVERVPVSGSMWDWAVDLSPGFELENSSLLEFLKWAAREAGLKLEFEGDDVMAETMRAELHGTISDMSPQEAIEAVLATTAFNYAIDGDRLVISKQR